MHAEPSRTCIEQAAAAALMRPGAPSLANLLPQLNQPMASQPLPAGWRPPASQAPGTAPPVARPQLQMLNNMQQQQQMQVGVHSCVAMCWVPSCQVPYLLSVCPGKARSAHAAAGLPVHAAASAGVWSQCSAWCGRAAIQSGERRQNAAGLLCYFNLHSRWFDPLGAAALQPRPQMGTAMPYRPPMSSVPAPQPLSEEDKRLLPKRVRGVGTSAAHLLKCQQS